MTTKFDDVMNVSEVMSVSEAKYFVPPLPTKEKKDNLYHLYSLKNVKNTHGRVLLLVTLQAEA